MRIFGLRRVKQRSTGICITYEQQIVILKGWSPVCGQRFLQEQASALASHWLEDYATGNDQYSAIHSLYSTMQQSNPLLPMNNYTRFVISWNDKNKQLTLLLVPKYEIFDRSYFYYFYTIKPFWVDDFGVKILTYYFNFGGKQASFIF